MARAGLFGGRPVGAVTLVDAPVSLSYARRARVAFVAVGVGVGACTAMVSGVFGHPPLVAVLVGVLVGLLAGFVAGVLVRAWPVLRVLWWWSLEITAVALVVLVPAWLARVTWPWLPLGLVVVLAATVALVGRLRRLVVAWWWCVVVRHRLRLCFAQVIRSGNRTQSGSLPLVLWARPTPAGERVWLWLRPGLDLVDLDGKTGMLAVACWAGEVRVLRASTRYAALTRVDVARRDPLTATVLSPLAGLIPAGGAAVPVSPGMPPLGLDLADIPDPVPERGGGRR